VNVPTPVVAWLPLSAVAAHIFEEFVWPGGFGDWYRSHYPDRAKSLSRVFLVWINVLLVVMSLIAAILWKRLYAVEMWLVVASVAGANGLFHLFATIRWRTYSPGLITGILLYLPLAAYGFVTFTRDGLLSPNLAIQAALIGPLYHAYSAWNHRRRSAAYSRAQN
jgi:hypothetical protein